MSGANPHLGQPERVVVEMSRPAAVFLRAMVAHINTLKRLPGTGREEALRTSAWLEEIAAAAQAGLEAHDV